MKKLFLIFIFLTSCITQTKNELLLQKSDFSPNMEFDDFKLQLEKYAKESSYPNLDE